ncbi:MAG: rhodanese-like domain-containing protein [Gammaproteobacteria bacterium]|nr:rhodanese-like domain-containing protein [Gammaproteobacteria bacterium]
MENIGEFYSNNLLLIVVWTILFYMIINSFIKGKWDKTPLEVVQIINKENTVVVDVREPSEFEAGHIADSVHIPLGQVKSRLNELDKYKNQTIVVSCRSGHRSSRAVSILRRSGYEQVFNLKGGIVAWEGEKLPVSKV